MPNNPVYHIASISDLADARSTGWYTCASLNDEGFIHCCHATQLAGVVERYYNGADNVELIRIDSNKLSSELVHENTVGGEELFPHIYGKINLDAVVEIVPFGTTERSGVLARIAP